MAGRGGSEVQSRQATRQRTRNGRVSTRMPMGSPQERLPATRPTATGSGGSGGPPTTTRTQTPTPNGRNVPAVNPQGTSVARRQIPLNLGPRAATSGAGGVAARSLLGPAGVIAGVMQPNTGLEAGARYEAENLPRAQAEQRASQEAIPEVTVTAPRVTPQRRPQGDPQGSLTADRLNALSLALVQGNDPSPQNASETVAVERMRAMMRQNEMSRGGNTMKPTMPRMPSVKPPKSPKMPNVKKPTMPRMPAMAKGGMAKKGKC